MGFFLEESYYILYTWRDNATTGDVRLSDRERAGLRGSIKTCSDFIDTDHRAVYRINLEGSGGIPMEVQDG